MHKNIGFLFILITTSTLAFAQQDDKGTDTFFLAKKTGLIGRLGRSIATQNQSTKPVKTVNQFNRYKGKVIRFIEIVPVGFNQELNDTAEIRRNFAIRVANKFHRNSREATIRKNLFFKEGDRFLPLLVSDNERFLRDLPYLRDAAIVVYKSIASNDSVDVIVLTRDVFSIGGGVKANASGRVRPNIREENLGGSGSRLAVFGLYDDDRHPTIGYGAEFTEANIKGSFVSGTIGFNTFRPAIANGRYEENAYYVKFEKPLVNRYTRWTGAFEVSSSRTTDVYPEDTLYQYHSQYKYNQFDLWGGYNIGWGRKKQTDSEKRLRHFVAAHGFYRYFDKVPTKFKDSFNYNYANLNGLLFSYTLYKQNFYTTNFIYGFGRNEDVPIGISATAIAGWTNKQDRLRGYYGIEFAASNYSQRGFFSSYIARIGANHGSETFEDVGLLLAVNHFTKLQSLSKKWKMRNFLSVSYASLGKVSLNEPLKLQSEFGLPYFRSDSLNYLEASSRITLKLESVFFNLRKFLGFRFAPFISTEVAFLKPVNIPGNKTDAYWALGGGVRTRNENLVFGTIELRGFYFPRVSTSEMSRWKLVFTSNLKFKYNSVLVTRPDFIELN